MDPVVVAGLNHDGVFDMAKDQPNLSHSAASAAVSLATWPYVARRRRSCGRRRPSIRRGASGVRAARRRLRRPYFKCWRRRSPRRCRQLSHGCCISIGRQLGHLDYVTPPSNGVRPNHRWRRADNGCGIGGRPAWHRHTWCRRRSCGRRRPPSVDLNHTVPPAIATDAEEVGRGWPTASEAVSLVPVVRGAGSARPYVGVVEITTGPFGSPSFSLSSSSSGVQSARRRLRTWPWLRHGRARRRTA